MLICKLFSVQMCAPHAHVGATLSKKYRRKFLSPTQQSIILSTISSSKILIPKYTTDPVTAMPNEF